MKTPALNALFAVISADVGFGLDVEPAYFARAMADFDVATVAAWEAWAAGLTKEQRETVAVGEQDDAWRALMETCPNSGLDCETGLHAALDAYAELVMEGE